MKHTAIDIQPNVENEASTSKKYKKYANEREYDPNITSYEKFMTFLGDLFGFFGQVSPSFILMSILGTVFLLLSKSLQIRSTRNRRSYQSIWSVLEDSRPRIKLDQSDN